MNNDRGVIYVATGELFLKMAAMSVDSLKKYNPSLPAHVFTDSDTTSYSCFDSVTKIADPNVRSKVNYVSETPYQQTLFLDADTRVCEDITHMFDLLDRYDIAMPYDNGRAKRPKRYIGEAPKIFLPLTSGVILYKKTERVIQFFKTWQETYRQKGHVRDQISLREALWKSDLNIWVLPPEYSVRPRGYLKVLKDAGITPKILHLDDFKREAGFKPPPISLRKKLKKIIKYKIIGKWILGLPH